MGGDDDMIETLRPARPFDRHAVIRPRHPRHRRAQRQAVCDGREQLLHIFAAPAFDGTPDRPARDLEQPVVLAEAGEGFRRIMSDLTGRDGPDRRGHRIEVILAKRRPIIIGVEIIAERRSFHLFEMARRLGVETADVEEHRPEARAEQILLLRKESEKVIACIFERAICERHGESHLRRLGRDPEMIEKRGEVRIGGLVVDDEAGVDRDLALATGDVDRIAVAAGAVVLLDDRDIMGAGQEPGRRQARHAGSHDSNFQTGIQCVTRHETTFWQRVSKVWTRTWPQCTRRDIRLVLANGSPVAPPPLRFRRRKPRGDPTSRADRRREHAECRNPASSSKPSARRRVA